MRSSRADADKKKVSRPRKDVSPPLPKAKSRKSSPGRSPDRGRPSSRTRSSPARKSPARRSPARKSPARADVQKSPAKRPAIKSDSELTISGSNANAGFKTKPRKTYAEYGIKDVSVDLRPSGDSNNGYGLRPRKSTPLQDLFPARRPSRLKDTIESVNDIIGLSSITKKPKEIFSNDDLSEEEDSKLQLGRNLTTPAIDDKKSVYNSEFGGRIGAFITLLLVPGLPLATNVFCNERSCSLTTLPSVSSFARIDYWFNWLALKVFLSYTAIIISTSLIPIGRKITVPGTKVVFRNNVIAPILTVILVTIAAKLYGIELYKVAYVEYFRLMVISLIVGVGLSIAAYVHSRGLSAEKRNPYGNSGSFIYDFCCGRDHQWTIGGVYVKSILLRFVLIVVLFYNVSFMIIAAQKNERMPKTYELNDWGKFVKSSSLTWTLITFATTHMLYLCSVILMENNFKHSFEVVEEGVGYITCVGYLTFPFLITALTKSILEHNIAFSPATLAFVWICSIVGIYINWASNRVKDIFRDNPLDPRVSHLETMPTFLGKRLIVSGWWGWVRHPNYFGDALAHIAWIPNWPVCILCLMSILYLVSRISRVEKRCERRYEAAWRRYTAKVPYAMIPYVY